MTFKTKFKIGDMVKYTNADPSDEEKRAEGFGGISLGEFRIYAVHLSCFANHKVITYQLAAVPGSSEEEEEVTEETLLKYNE